MPNLRQNASLPQLNVHSKNIINLTVEGCFIQLSQLNTENVSIYVNKSSNDFRNFMTLSHTLLQFSNVQDCNNKRGTKGVVKVGFMSLYVRVQ